MCQHKTDGLHTSSDFFPLAKQLNVQPDRPHEQVDMAKSCCGKFLRQSLAHVDGVHNAILDTDNEALLLLSRRTGTHRCEELPHVDILIILDRAGENVWQDRLDGVEKTVVQLLNLLKIRGGGCRRRRALLDQFCARDEDGKDGQTDLRAHKNRNVGAIQHQTQKAYNDVQGRFVHVCEERRHDSLSEEFDFLLSRTRERRKRIGRDAVLDHVESVKVHDNHGQDRHALLLINVAEDARDGLLALGVGQDGNERVGNVGTSHNRFHDLETVPQLLVELLDLVLPLHVLLNLSRVAAVIQRRWHATFMIFHLHQNIVNVLDVAQGRLAVGCTMRSAAGAASGTVRLALPFSLLDVQQGLWRLRVAKRDLAKTALDNELLVLWLRLGSLDSALHLLLHALSVIVATSVVPAATVAATGLKEVGLGELVGRLMRVLTRSSTDLREDLVVEVLGKSRLGGLIVNTASSRNELLKLDACDEVLVLRRHEAIILGKHVDLVDPLRTFGIFLKESSTLSIRKAEQLLGMGDDRALVRRATSMGWTGRRHAGERLSNGLARTGQTVRVLEDLAGLLRRLVHLCLRRCAPRTVLLLHLAVLNTLGGQLMGHLLLRDRRRTLLAELRRPLKDLMRSSKWLLAPVWRKLLGWESWHGWLGRRLGNGKLDGMLLSRLGLALGEHGSLDFLQTHHLP